MMANEQVMCACGRKAEILGYPGIQEVAACPMHGAIMNPVKKPYEAPKVTDVDLENMLTHRNMRARLRAYFEASPKTSFGLGDIYEGIDKVLLG